MSLFWYIHLLTTFSSVVFSLNLSFPFGFFFSISFFFLVFYSFLLAWHFHLLLSNYFRCISTLLLFLRLLFYQLRNSLLFLHFRRHLFLVTSDLCAPFPVFMTVPFPSHLPISIGHNSYPGGDPIRTSRRHLISVNTTDRRHACFGLFLFHYRQILKFVREKTRKIKVEREKKWACRPVTTKSTRNECDSSQFFLSNVFLFFFFSHLSSLGTFHSLTQLHQKSLWSRRRLFRTIFKINSSTRHDF